MKKNTKKLVLNKETLRDLTAQNAGEVKGGGKSKMCKFTHWCGSHYACY
jgi:hypothetical protein